MTTSLRNWRASTPADADADFLETNFPYFQSEYWELDLRWIREVLESPPSSADDLCRDPGTLGAMFAPNDVDLTESPQFTATRLDDMRATDSTPLLGGPLVVATIRSTGNSTGPRAFDVNVLNLCLSI